MLEVSFYSLPNQTLFSKKCYFLFNKTKFNMKCLLFCYYSIMVSRVLLDYKRNENYSTIDCSFNPCTVTLEKTEFHCSVNYKPQIALFSNRFYQEFLITAFLFCYNSHVFRATRCQGTPCSKQARNMKFK